MGRICSVSWCERKHYCKGHCKAHHSRLIRGQNLEEPFKRVSSLHGQWGDWEINPAGYIWRRRWVDGAQEREYEHRTTWERENRPLLPGEEIHHRNGVRNDNRIGNLELWVVRQPKGQRPADLLKWADEIIATYRT